MSNDLKANTVVEDFLDEDTEIPGQRFVLLSFLSPEKVLDKKELFFFKKFLESYEVEWKVKNLEKYLVDVVGEINSQLDDRVKELEKADQFDAAEICRKNRLRLDDVLSGYQSFVQKNRADIQKTKIVEAYEDFIFAQKAKLEEEFYVANEFRTSMRGLKVRGVFGNVKEAEIKAKKLQNKDKYHNIFMAEVGKWTPWDPNPHEVKDQEYNNDQLNTLMKKYRENEDSREQFFEQRTKSSKQVFGANTNSSSASVSDTYGGMFGSQGDLALQRKLEKPSITIEKVEENSDSKEESKDSKE
jgi:hypothetical protein